MDDRDFANFYTQVWQKIDEDISQTKIFTLIQNREVTPSYNPIIKWFEDHKTLKPSGQLKELISCFNVNQEILVDSELLEVDNYLDIFMVKWLIGLIGSAYGTYSLMILVLNGEQGTNKTEFFRNLLPEKLRSYYAESNLDEGKDSEILMTKKWLIVDDEFGGKSKRDATKLKRLSSQQTFTIRMPYGRMSEDLRRLAVLAGTSNDYEVINDPTGNRRIIPVNIESLDIDRFKAIDKDLLFIELYQAWQKNKTKWFLTKQEIELLNKITIKNTEVMPEVEAIQKLFDFDEYGAMTNTDVMREININYPHLRTNSKRIGQALKICGHEQSIKKMFGKTCRVYSIVGNS
ncbi:MAG: hypothetical protein GWN62_16760 [Aliifodinibius sp.]|nr:hypothetical protein [Fodinibius sp.]